MAALRRRWGSDSALPVLSNLGISTSYRVEFRSGVPDVYLFGKPEQYVGERGALYLSRFLTAKSSAFIDIGSHQGYFVFFVRAGVKSKLPIYYVEPDPGLFRQIHTNVEKNKLCNVFGLQAAVGATTGKATFYLAPASLISTLKGELSPMQQFTKIQVDLLSFDDFTRERDLSNLCVKVDIENAEFDFLQGANRESARIKYLICEMLEPAEKRGFVNAAKQALGMEAYYINDFQLEHSPDGTFKYVPTQYNWLFCREKPDALRQILAPTPFSVMASPASLKRAA